MAFDLLPETLSALLGSGVGAALKWSGDRFSHVYIADRALKKCWHFLEDDTHVFLPVSGSKDGARGGYGDLLAMAQVITLTNRLFKSTRSLTVHADQQDLQRVKEQNLVVIGGGKHNAVFRALVEELRVPLHFFDTASESFHEIRNRERSIVFTPEYSADGTLAQDLGLAVRCRNPWNKEKWVLIAAGSHTYGSAAVMEFLLRPSVLRELRPHFSGNLEIVVRAAVEQHTPMHVERISTIVTW